MKSGRTIDISKSSLVSLKAELSRKQEEVKEAKLHDSYIRPVPKPKKELKLNPGVKERDEKDKEEISEEEVNLLQKSREVLELKSKLYGKLQTGNLVQDPGQSEYLVNFKQKAIEENVAGGSRDESAGTVDEKLNSEDEADYFSDSDSDWVEFTDCLGRTRKCLKEDLSHMKTKDRRLAETLNLDKPETTTEVEPNPEEQEERLPDLMSSDMHREIMRQKWEEQELKNAEKKNIYYEDMRFDEARTHGVGYFQFSTDDAVREQQQEMLKKVRAETEKKQDEARMLRERRDRQKQARLVAARQRQRARLGLPPIQIQDTDLEVTAEEEKPQENKEDETEKTKEALEVALKRAAHVRPWDVGKDGVREPVMTQAEWVEKKRSERPEEFAPAYAGGEEKTFPDPPSKKKTFTSRPLKRPARNIPSPSCDGDETARGTGAEIPPPPTFDYYASGSNQAKRPRSRGYSLGTEEAIEAGLRYLRQQAEKASHDKALDEIL